MEDYFLGVTRDKAAISRDDKSSGIRGASDDDAHRLILNTYKPCSRVARKAVLCIARMRG